MSTDLKKLNSKSGIVTMTFIELEEGEIANEETLSPSPNLKAHSRSKEGKSSSKKHNSSKHKIHTSSDSESSDQEEQARKGWWNKKKLHVSSSQHSSSKSKEDVSDSDGEYIEKPMPDYASLQYKKKKFKKRNNKKKNYPQHQHHHHHKTHENESSVSSTSKEKENKNPEPKKRNLYPCKFYIAFGKCDDINCHCIHAPLKEEELRRFIDENEQFFSDAFKALPKTPINPTLIPILSKKFPSTNPQNTTQNYLPSPMPPPKFLSPQLHPQYPLFSPTNLHPVYSFPVPQVISPQQARFPGQPIYANPSIYFEFNMQQNLTYLPQNPQFFSHPQMLIPASMINPNFQTEIPQASGSPLQIQSTASVNIFTASKDLQAQAQPGMIGRRRSSMDTAPGSETYEVNGNEKGISPDSGQEKEDELKKAKTAEKLTRLVELFKAKNPTKEEPKESPKIKALSENHKEAKSPFKDDIFKQWEEPKREAIKSKFLNGSANDELLKKISSELAQNPTQSGSGNVKDLVNMYLKLSKNLITENNSIH